MFKTIDLSRLDGDRAAEAVNAAERAVEQSGGDPAYDLFYDEPKDSPYETYYPDHTADGGDIPVRQPDGTSVSFSSLSPLTAALKRQLMFRRLHFSGRFAGPIARAISRSKN